MLLLFITFMYVVDVIIIMLERLGFAQCTHKYSETNQISKLSAARSQKQGNLCLWPRAPTA